MAKKGIDEWSLRYLFLKVTTRLVFYNFYKKYQVVHRDRIEKNQPIIFAPNHQNALMDALNILYVIPQQPIFLARSDIFKGNLLIKFLTIIKIMPVYRIRDGVEKLKKNEEIFEQTLQILKNKHNPLCVMPEGNHGGKRRLRNLVKGIFRIAFMAQKDYGTKPGVKIVPVGLDYGHYQKFGQTLFVNFGEPIEVCEYFKEFEENEPIAINKLRDRLAVEMKKQMIHIETEEFYDTYMALRTIYNENMRSLMGIKGSSLYDKFKADKEMIRVLDENASPEELESIKANVEEYNNIIEKFNFRDWVFKKTKYPIFGQLASFVLLIIGFPLFLLGFINNYLPFKIPAKLTKGIKDPQFISSFKYVISFISFIVYYIILITLALIFLKPLWLKLVYIALIHPSGVFAYRYYVFVKKWNAKARYNKWMRKKNPDISKMPDLRNRILEKMDKIVLKAINKK